MPAWAGLWNDVYSGGHALTGSREVLPRRVGMAYAREGMIAQRAVSAALNGAAPGATATASKRQVEAVQSAGGLGLGGKRTVESKTIINRATTAGDKTALDAVITMPFAPATYPVEKSGTGGGGKLSSMF